MILARVTGNVVSTAKHPSMTGNKLLLVTPEGLDGELALGAEMVAVDGVGAGVGERVVVVVEGRAAGEVAGVGGAPVDAAIVGIVDTVDLDVGQVQPAPPVVAD